MRTQIWGGEIGPIMRNTNKKSEGGKLHRDPTFFFSDSIYQLTPGIDLSEIQQSQSKNTAIKEAITANEQATRTHFTKVKRNPRTAALIPLSRKERRMAWRVRARRTVTSGATTRARGSYCERAALAAARKRSALSSMRPARDATWKRRGGGRHRPLRRWDWLGEKAKRFAPVRSLLCL